MTQADLTKLDQLSAEQQDTLSDEQKAIFVMLSPGDQKFFAQTFSPKDLPKALDRKGEIMLFNKASRERFDRLKGMIAESPTAVTLPGQGPVGGENMEDIVTGAAAALGIGGALAYSVATDNTARWQGVQPRDLIAPLENEFENQQMTDIEFEGTADVLEGTIFVASSGRFVPALTIHLVKVQNGTEVKMGDLTSRGFLETLRGGSEKVLRLAQKGLYLWGRRGRGNPADLIGMANDALSDTAGLADLAGNLRLKERAWAVIKNTGAALEKAYQERVAQERAARYALEAAWDRYYACPTCAVPFAEDDTVCRVCGTARPEPPQRPDPRKV